MSTQNKIKKMIAVKALLKEIEGMIVDHLEDDAENGLTPLALISSSVEQLENYLEDEDESAS